MDTDVVSEMSFPPSEPAAVAPVRTSEPAAPVRTSEAVAPVCLSQPDNFAPVVPVPVNQTNDDRVYILTIINKL